MLVSATYNPIEIIRLEIRKLFRQGWFVVWIPAFAGMTEEDAGVEKKGASLTEEEAEMTEV